MPPLLRFAPSPTGPLHLGGLRTALFNHLFALKHGGKWILRIEDTDATRLVPSSLDSIRKGLEWAGLEYNFGPGIGGPHAPYFQSKRLDLYHQYSKKLLESGDAYRCFCTHAELDQKKKDLQESGSTMTYDRTCLKMTDEEVARRVRAGKKHIIRINDTKSPSLPPFSDLVFGEVRDAQGSLPTDPVLLKADLFPTYHLASIVDDHEMGITHVIRGEEWLPSLPLHRSLYTRLGLSEPRFGHLPLLLNGDGSKMSKRKGDVGVHDFMNNGWEPSAVLNWLAIAGRNVNNPLLSSQIPVTLSQLVEQFDLANYTRRRAVLDRAVLSQLNKAHIQRLVTSEDPTSQESVIARAIQLVKERYPNSSLNSPSYVTQVLSLMGDRIERIGQLTDVGRMFFDGGLALEQPMPCDPTIYVSVIDTFANWIKDAWDENELSNTLHNLSGQVKDPKNGSTVGRRTTMLILRHGLGGEKNGPPLGETILLLGRDEVLRRLEAVIAQSGLSLKRVP
ncbi:hypothetical protein M408DRAFT_306041 [Serendipita vermifera MAFF 305830]|uniref:Glutamate--tRNA ligase, mitochondrial n=1 Tax=Serendipita vermifera MAFF 305830 TaxID=933852 RepID=A0A0C3AXA0_SERVB|nr:hypothetical protein M408DRAFT_306041 [Serendipita vermifera MAFF 305830]